MKRKLFLGIFLSLLFIYLSFWKPDFRLIFSGSLLKGFIGSPRIDVGQLFDALRSARYLYLIVIVAFLYLGWWIRAWRWQLLAEPVKKVSAGLSFSALMIGYLGNNVLPLRAGEFMRAYVAAKRSGMPVSSALAVVVVERILDMLMLLLCFTLSLLLFPLPGLFRNAGIIILIATVVLIVFLLLLLFQRDRALNLAEFFLKIFPLKLRRKFLKIISDFADGLEIFRRGERYLLVLFWTFVMWGIYFLIIYISLYFFNFTDTLIYRAPAVTSIVMMTITTAGIGIPSAPGAVGTYHGVCLFGMGLFGVPSEIGLSYAILMHISNFLPMTLIGIVCLFKEGLHLTEIAGAARKEVSADNKPI